MKKTITIAAYNRPQHLRKLLGSLRTQLLPLDDFGVVVSVDVGGDKFDEVMKVARTIDFASYQLFHTDTNQGTNHNTYWLMNYVFETLAVDYNVYLEDDLVLSPDAFNLVEWYIEELNNENIGAYCLCRLWEHGAPEKVYLSNAFVGWGFLMDRSQWRTYAKPVWLNSRGTWDTAMARHIRTFKGVHNAFPELSRVTNTGRTGERVTGAKWDRFMQNHVYNRSREEYSFQFMGVV